MEAWCCDVVVLLIILPSHPRLSLASSSSMPQITEINDEEIISEAEKDRIIRSTGIMDRLPPDFIPFDPTNTQPFVEGMRPSELLRRQAAGRSQPAAAAARDERGAGGIHSQQAWNTDSSEEEDEEESEAESDLSAETLMKQQVEQGMNPTLESVLDLIIWTMPFGESRSQPRLMALEEQTALIPAPSDRLLVRHAGRHDPAAVRHAPELPGRSWQSDRHSSL